MGDLDAAIKDWVKKHPYLKEIARLQEIIEAVIENNDAHAREAISPYVSGEHVLDEFKRGIPILKAEESHEDIIKDAESLIIKMIDALVTASLPDQIITQSLQAKTVFAEKADLAGRLVAEVIKDNTVKDSQKDMGEVSEGFFLFLAWSALSSALEPLKEKVSALSETQPWLKGYCPVCGQLPAMAYLERKETYRDRDLVCGCCRTRWRFKRMGCPYCGNDDQKTLKIIGLDEDPEFRIDTCEKCKGYLKTYTGEGQEQVALADWSTLHLDLIAKKHDFKRIGYRMYGV